MKRVSVIFRGTVGASDIIADLNAKPNYKQYFQDIGIDVGIHSGFAGKFVL